MAGWPVGRLGEQAGALSEEAAAHGWHGIAQHMQAAGESLEAALTGLSSGHPAAERGAAELTLLSTKIPAQDVAGHLATASADLETATTEVQGALEQIGEARDAVTEVGQEGMMQATADLHDHVTGIHERIAEQQRISARERAAADALVRRQLGKGSRVAQEDPPRRHPGTQHPTSRSRRSPRRIEAVRFLVGPASPVSPYRLASLTRMRNREALPGNGHERTMSRSDEASAERTKAPS